MQYLKKNKVGIVDKSLKKTSDGYILWNLNIYLFTL